MDGESSLLKENFVLFSVSLAAYSSQKAKNIEMAIFLKKGGTSQSYNNFLFGLLHTNMHQKTVCKENNKMS